MIIKHVRLFTDNEYHHVQCPYNLNYLTFRLLNYSNENCFNVYSTLNNNNPCQNHRSPCKFHSKSIQLNCNHHSYSNQVDITYQCSYKRINSYRLNPYSSNNPEENIALFLIGFGIVIIFWILICCIWVIRSRNDDDKSELITSSQSHPKQDLISFNKNNLLITDNLCLHVNPFENNNHISSLRTTKII